MVKKYEFVVDDTAKEHHTTVTRIRALVDIDTLMGVVKAGTLGGFIEHEANLSHEGTCWVANNARVLDKAFVQQEAYVGDNAIVTCSSEITGKAHISDNARVCGQSKIRGNATIGDNAVINMDFLGQITDHASVYDTAKIYGDALILDAATVCDRAVVRDNAMVSGEAVVGGSAAITQEAHVKDNAKICEYAEISGKAVVKQHAIVGGKTKVSDNVTIEGKALLKADYHLKGNSRIRIKPASRARYASDYVVLAMKEGNTIMTLTKNQDVQIQYQDDVSLLNEFVQNTLPSLKMEDQEELRLFIQLGQARLTRPQTEN